MSHHTTTTPAPDPVPPPNLPKEELQEEGQCRQGRQLAAGTALLSSCLWRRAKEHLSSIIKTFLPLLSPLRGGGGEAGGRRGHSWMCERLCNDLCGGCFHLPPTYHSLSLSLSLLLASSGMAWRREEESPLTRDHAISPYDLFETCLYLLSSPGRKAASSIPFWKEEAVWLSPIIHLHPFLSLKRTRHLDTSQGEGRLLPGWQAGISLYLSYQLPPGGTMDRSQEQGSSLSTFLLLCLRLAWPGPALHAAWHHSKTMPSWQRTPCLVAAPLSLHSSSSLTLLRRMPCHALLFAHALLPFLPPDKAQTHALCLRARKRLPCQFGQGQLVVCCIFTCRRGPTSTPWGWVMPACLPASQSCPTLPLTWTGQSLLREGGTCTTHSTGQPPHLLTDRQFCLHSMHTLHTTHFPHPTPFLPHHLHTFCVTQSCVPMACVSWLAGQWRGAGGDDLWREEEEERSTSKQLITWINFSLWHVWHDILPA